jgi:Ca2+-binding RTX toxin-like protein
LDRLPSWLTEAGNAGGYQWSFDGSRFIDANQDGFLDLALLPKFTNERPLLLLNDRHGSFDNVAPVPLPSGLFGPGSIVSSPDGGYISKGTVNFTNAVADLNKDGFPDLILGQANWDDSTGASYSSGRLQILINNQGAGFTDETAIRLVDMPLPATNGTNYFNPLVADLNGDGWSDLVVTVITDYAQQSSRVFINDKTGRLVQDNSFPSTGLLLPIDTNADGLIDLVSLDYRTIGSSQEGFGIFAPQIVIYQNQGEPSPTPPVVTLPDSPVVTPQPSVTVTTAVSMTLPEGSYNLVAEGTGNISLIGNALNNIIVGNKGKNAINGGAGADRVNGGLGNDNLMGGSGKDAFVFSTKLGTSKTDRTVNFDTIKDFAAKDDSLYLDNAILKKLGKKGSEKTPAKLDKKFFVVGDKAKDKDDYIVYNKKTGVLSYDADGSGTRQAVEFALLKNKAALKYDDFFVI